MQIAAITFEETARRPEVYGNAANIVAGVAKMTQGQLLGRYFSGMIALCETAMLIAPVQGDCGRAESYFHDIGEFWHERSNYHWDEKQLANMRRHLQATVIKAELNTVRSKQVSKDDKKRLKLYAELKLGPEIMVGGNGEKWHLGVKTVKSLPFVLKWFLRLPEYLLGQRLGQHTWWVDGNEALVDHVRSTSIVCDFSATTGATLHCAAFETLPELRESLLIVSKAVMGRPDQPFPGWRSGGHAMTFLTREVGKMEVTSASLRKFLIDVGVMRERRDERE